MPRERSLATNLKGELKRVGNNRSEGPETQLDDLDGPRVLLGCFCMGDLKNALSNPDLMHGR